MSIQIQRETGEIEIFKYSKGNFADIKSELLDLDLYFLDDLRAGTVQEKWNKLKQKSFSLVENYIPVKYTSTRYNPPWFNQTLRKLNRRVQRLYNVQKRIRL